MIGFNEQKYIDVLGYMESHNNYSIENSLGYLGRYQFGVNTLNNLKSLYGLPDWKNKYYFLSHPDLQDQYELAYIKNTYATLKAKNFDRFIGKIITGSMRFTSITAPLNIYGIMAMLHLGSPNAVKNYLENNIDSNDGQTSLSDYGAYFSSVLNDTANYLPLLLAFIPAIVLYYL